MKDDGCSKQIDPVAYKSMVGSLIYHPIRTLYPNKIIVSNKLLGLLGLGSGLGSG